MGKLSSSIVKTFLARVIKAGMVAILLPVAAGLLIGILGELERISLSGATFREWVTWGFVTYVTMHLLLYRPTPLFRASHRLFSVLAVWLFGGQVSSMQTAGAKGKAAKGKGEAVAQGSTLVAFSPYVIPLYTVLVCALGWVLQRGVLHTYVEGPVSFLIGTTLAFHWVMTADDLQEQRSRWHVETYLLALGLVFILTLLIGAACLPWAVAEFSFIDALANGLSAAQEILTTLVQRLFL